MTPNTVRTLVSEFGRHAFSPSFITEDVFCRPSTFSFLGRRLSRRANKARMALMTEASRRYLNRRRGYPRRYLEVDGDEAVGGNAGGAGLFFRRRPEPPS